MYVALIYCVIHLTYLLVCAEAYSRMAQVQQYLDPETREQYAQGHLDQRVEQVLQEIRDLSIAGAS